MTDGGPEQCQHAPDATEPARARRTLAGAASHTVAIAFARGLVEQREGQLRGAVEMELDEGQPPTLPDTSTPKADEVSNSLECLTVLDDSPTFETMRQQHGDSPTFETTFETTMDTIVQPASSMGPSGAATATSVVATSIARSVHREAIHVIDMTDAEIHERLRGEAQGDEKYYQTLKFAFTMITEVVAGGLIIAVIPKERKSQLRFQTLDEHYMLGRLLKDSRHGMNIHRQHERVTQALCEFAEHTDSDRWPMDHKDMRARGHPKDGGVIFSKHGTALAAAARFEHSSCRWVMGSAGTRHNSALALAEWLQDSGVVFVRSDRGTVHVMVPKQILGGVYRWISSREEAEQGSPHVVEQSTTLTQDSRGIAHVASTRWRSFVRSATKYTFQWGSFTSEMSESISREMKPDIMPLAQILFVPFVVVMLSLLVPLRTPDEGLHGNLLYVFFLLPSCMFVSVYPFTFWFSFLLGEKLHHGLCIAWCAIVASIIALSNYMLSQYSGTYPVPFIAILAVPVVCFLAPLLWFCVPRQRRRAKEVQSRLAWALGAIIAPALVFGVVYPVFRANFYQLDTPGQLGSFIVHLLARLVIERIGEFLASKLSMSIYPVFIFAAVYNYELANCSMAPGVKQPYIWGVPLLADLLENVYYTYCLRRHQWSGADWARSRECILAVLLVREFIEIVAPLQVTALVLGVDASAGRRFNCLVANLSREDVRQTAFLLLATALVQIASLVVTSWYLKTLGLRPLEFLCGLCASTGRCLFTTCAAGALMWFMVLQHTHTGCDLSFKFNWVGSEDQRWVSCFQWEPRS